MSKMQACLQAVRSIVPPLSHTTHKGCSGRIGVVGGSLEYTGAPYFAAISAMKIGADLVHVFCPEDAAVVIKSYSPELIVHPLLSSRLPEDKVVESIKDWLPRLHSLIIGPGLGRDPLILSRVKKLITAAKQMQKNLVIDADGLFLICQEPEIITSYSKAILTPNAGEFPRLYQKVFGEDVPVSSSESKREEGDREATKSLAAKMGGVTILRKGFIDIISDGNRVIECREEGCTRRCGGQGDVLAGITGTLSFWATEREKQLNEEFGLSPTMVAAYGACFVTKKSAETAFSRHHRSMLTSDLVSEIGATFDEHLECS